MANPKHQPQLGRGPCPNDGTTDCNVRAHQMLFGWSSDNDWVPSISKIRAEMGRPCNDATNLHNAKTAAASMGFPLWKNINEPWSRVISYLKQNKPVVISMRYSILNRKQPNKSGDPNFGGGHGILLLGTRKRPDGKRVILSWDALYDGRRRSIPKGPQWVLASTLKASAVGFAKAWGGGNGTSDAWYTIGTKKRANSRTNRSMGDVGHGEDTNDDTELILPDVESERNTLLTFAGDVDFYDLVIESQDLPLELRQEAEAMRTLARATMNYEDVDPALEPEDGIDTDVADPDPNGGGAPNVELSASDEDDIINEAEKSEQVDEEEAEDA